MSGKLFIISAPSGTGKSTIVERVRLLVPELEKTISCTTRPMRHGEVNGLDYFFISEDEFNKKVKEGYFAEWVEVFGYKYGTPRDQLDEAIAIGKKIALVIEVIGALKLKAIYPKHAVSIFVMPPDENALRARLSRRNTETEESMNTRIARAMDEIKYAAKYDYVVINDDLDKAVREVAAIIAGVM